MLYRHVLADTESIHADVDTIGTDNGIKKQSKASRHIKQAAMKTSRLDRPSKGINAVRSMDERHEMIE